MNADPYAGSDVSTATLKVANAEIPALGFGTYGVAGTKLRAALIEALRQGFHHIDTAQMYQNERDVGDAIRVAGVPRTKVFTTTKVWVGNYGRADFIRSVDQSLENLRTDYIDLLLVHWPRGGAPIAEQVEGLNKAVDLGKARYIGVSNYSSEMLHAATTLSKHPLVTNQVEYHPFLDQRVLLAQVKQEKTSLMAYCGMAVGRIFESPVLKDIAARHNRSVAQIVLRWLIQQPRVVALSRTENFDRIPANTKIFDFMLSEKDMAAIGTLQEPGSRIVNPGHLAPNWDS